MEFITLFSLILYTRANFQNKNTKGKKWQNWKLRGEGKKKEVEQDN